jgi:hypothetical protein
MEGMQMRQADAERNMLRQAQVMQFQQAQQDRAFQLEERKKQAEREAQFDKIADLLAQHDMEPDDPKVLSRFMQEAMKARNPQLASVISGMAERAAKRRAEREEAAAVAAAMAPPTLPPGPPLRQNAMAPAAPVNALAAPQQPQNLFAGTPFDIGMGMAAPAAEPTAAPAAAPATAQAARLAELERQRSNLESLPRQTDTSRARLASIDREIARLSPKPLQGEAATMQALGLPLTPEGYARFKGMGQRGTPSETEELVMRLEDQTLTPAARKRLEARLDILTKHAPKEAKEPAVQPPVAVVDDATGRVKYVTREEALGKTPASAMEGLPPKEIQRREAVFPQAKQSVTTVTNTMSTIEQTIDRLLQNKSGLNGVTGLVYGRTPAVTDAARAADADLEQLANLAFVQGITELRASSKTGAGVGNVSNREGDRFENLKASLKRTQSYSDMVAALTRLKAQATSTKDTVNTEFTDMYEYRQNRAAPTGAAPAATKSGATVSNW